jgi:thiol-disulfide isomerase/thioredoxin
MKFGTAVTHALLLCAALAPCVGGARAHALPGGVGKQAPAAKGATARKDAAAAEAAKKTATAERPQVKEIDETALKTLLDEHKQNGRRLLINFWATWCTPCREEFPDLVRIEQEFGARADFEFITISLDDISEITKAVPDFLSETGAASLPAYLINPTDPEAVITLIDRSWFGDLPATFLFGRDGALIFRHTGRVKPDELRKAIQDSDK